MKFVNSSKLLIVVLAFFLSLSLYAQKESDMDKLYWSDSERIAIEDFGIQSTDAKSGLSSAAFSLEYNVHGLSFMAKNFNKRVWHYMVRSASQITMDENVNTYIRYQQTLFDLEEVYVRKFRKALSENRKKFLLRNAFADELKEEIIGTDLIKRQTQYNNETNAAKNEEKQKQWETQIKKELNELKNYAYDK